MPAGPSIKFSHRYEKLRLALGDDLTATLLHVHPIRLEDLSGPLLAYDTDDGTYELPKKGLYLMLFFLGSKGLFITLRRQTPQKEAYYRSLVGKTLAVVIA